MRLESFTSKLGKIRQFLNFLPTEVLKSEHLLYSSMEKLAYKIEFCQINLVDTKAYLHPLRTGPQSAGKGGRGKKTEAES